MSAQTDQAIQYINAAFAAASDIQVKLDTIISELQHAGAVLTGMDVNRPPLLNVPWVGQNVANVNTDDYSNSDCGPASLAMWLSYLNNPQTVDAVSKATGLSAGYTYTMPAHLITAAQAFNLKLTRAFNLTLESIKKQIDADKPLIVLVHYGSMLQRFSATFKAGHWLIVTGYEDEFIVYNDPLAPSDTAGKALRIDWASFDKAMADCALDGNTPRQGLVSA